VQSIVLVRFTVKIPNRNAFKPNIELFESGRDAPGMSAEVRIQERGFFHDLAEDRLARKLMSEIARRAGVTNFSSSHLLRNSPY
ncbi:hypothetical protein AKJ36_03190, partial [candidate division MSBL1 archaeon SCGC-AAA259I07]